MDKRTPAAVAVLICFCTCTVLIASTSSKSHTALEEFKLPSESSLAAKAVLDQAHAAAGTAREDLDLSSQALAAARHKANRLGVVLEREKAAQLKAAKSKAGAFDAQTEAQAQLAAARKAYERRMHLLEAAKRAMDEADSTAKEALSEEDRERDLAAAASAEREREQAAAQAVEAARTREGRILSRIAGLKQLLIRGTGAFSPQPGLPGRAAARPEVRPRI